MFLRKHSRACALIGLHLTAADGASGSGSQSPDLADAGRTGWPRSPEWDSDVGVWTEGECTPRCEVYEHSKECRALEVIGRDSTSGRDRRVVEVGLTGTSATANCRKRRRQTKTGVCSVQWSRPLWIVPKLKNGGVLLPDVEDWE